MKCHAVRRVTRCRLHLAELEGRFVPNQLLPLFGAGARTDEPAILAPPLGEQAPASLVRGLPPADDSYPFSVPVSDWLPTDPLHISPFGPERHAPSRTTTPNSPLRFPLLSGRGPPNPWRPAYLYPLGRITRKQQLLLVTTRRSLPPGP